MKRTHHLADDLGGFLGRAGGIKAQSAHAEEDAPMHGLKTVARIRQRAIHDGRQRVGEITLLERFAQWNVVCLAFRRENQFLAHGNEVSGIRSARQEAGVEVSG